MQATAVAPTALEAEIRAKAALLSGPDGAAAWLPDGGVLVFATDGTRSSLPGYAGRVGGDHDGRLTSRTIAALSGVSQTTVSRVLAGHPNVSDATRSRVLGVLAETGYTPNAAAQAMRRRRSGMLGVVVGRVTNPFFPELAEALHREITRHGLLMNLWISDGGEDDAGERAALDAVGGGDRRRRLHDGDGHVAVAARGARRAAPVVLLNRTLPGVAVDSVSSDNAGGAVALARHFLALGHRRIGLVAGPEGVSTSAERERGFLAALAEAGAEALAVRGDFTHASGMRGIEELARSPGGPPTAVFAINDVVAFGVIDGARRLGLDVPGGCRSRATTTRRWPRGRASSSRPCASRRREWRRPASSCCWSGSRDDGGRAARAAARGRDRHPLVDGAGAVRLSRTRSSSSSAMASDEVAAGDGALRTQATRPELASRKSSTRRPSAPTAWARTPARAGTTSPPRSSGT